MKRRFLSLFIVLTMLLSTIPLSAMTAFTEESYDAVINVVDGTGTGTGWTFASGEIWINENGSYLISGDGEQTSNRIRVNTGVTASVTLDNVNINVNLPFECGDNSNVTVVLADDSNNVLQSWGGHAGLRVKPTAKLTLSTAGQSVGNGSLFAYGGADSSSSWASAGIGGSELESSGIIVIDGGTIFSKGGNGRTPGAWRGPGAAGIGGAQGRACGDITINGGTVTAIGGDINPEGAGIGGGSSDPSIYGGKITISGGTVRAYSGQTGPSGTGIGFCSTIAIADTADVKAYSSGSYPAIYGTTDMSGHSAFLLNLMLDVSVSQDTDITIAQIDDNTDILNMTLLANYKNFASTVETTDNYSAGLSDGTKKVVALADESTVFQGISESPNTAISLVDVKLKANPVCKIDTTEYGTLGEALAVAIDGDTITLLKSIEYNEHIHLVDKNLTLDLNGFTFNLNNPVGDGLWVDNGSWNLTGLGEFNVSAKYYAVYAYEGGSATVTNAISTGDAGFSAAVASGSSSTITVLGDALAEGTSGKAVNSTNDANIVVWGDALATGYEGQAVEASNNAHVTIHGNATSSGNNAYYNIHAINGGNVLIEGNVEATGSGSSYGIYPEGENSSIEVLGNLTGTAIGVYCRNLASALIHGNVTATAGDAILVESSGNVDVFGDVVATGGAGASVSIGTATIEGSITSTPYLVLYGIPKTINETTEPTTKLGYRTYNHNDSTNGDSTVWVKETIDDSNWINGITSIGQYPFGGGDGSSEALAYEISTTNQLAQLAYNVNNGNDYTGKYFKLMNDLDLSGKEWTPIGYRFYPGQENGFNGNFDGNNKRITNIAIGSSSEPKTGGDQTQAGLFGATRYVANIKDLHVHGSLYVHNVSNVGMLLGFSESEGTITGCSTEGTIVSTGSGDIRIGGLVGDTSGTTVIRCSSDVDISASNGSMAVGGLIGYHGAFSYDRIRPLDSCIYTGTLTSGNVPSYGGVGGIAGKSYGYTIIYNSVNKGTITGSEGNIGGIVGIQHNEGIINCYSSGTVAGNGNYPSAVGGITGYIDWGKVYNCYDSGRVSSTGTALVGALVGNAPNSATIVSNGYFDGTINDDLAHVRSTSGNKYYLHEFTTEVMKGADPGSDFEYADGVYANGENAIIEALNGWIDLKQSTYPDTIFKEWTIISTLNDGYPNLTDAEEPGPSNDATLSALAASGVTLSPAFSSSVTSYSANVYNSKTSVSIAATSSNSNAVVNINGDNTLTKDVNLAVGSNTITILVTAEDTITTETYTITLNRAAASSGGGSSKPTAPPPVNVTTETTNDITTNKTTTDTEETNGTAEADITTPMVNALLQKANETSGTDKGDLFEVDMNIHKDIDKLDVTISQSNLARIASQTDVGLALTSSFASITFDGRALETIAGANSGGDVLISASLVDKTTLSEKDRETAKDRPVYDFSVFNSGTQVSDFKDGKATVSVPYTLQPGEDPESVVIYHLADNGSLKTVRGHYDAASGSVIFTTSHFSKFIVGYNQVSFTDVLPGSWYKNAVDFIAAREITSGTAPGIFSPDAKLTRGQFVVLLMNAYQINIQNQESTNQIQNFSDAGNTYYTNHLKAAKALGIVNGVGNNLFAPEKEITRQEMFVMLHNALKAIDEVPEVVISKDLSSFNDANQIDDWANEAFTNLVNAGIVTGSNNKLNPTHNTTRAEIAQVLYNLFTK